MRSIYFDCYSGVAGDMVLAALLNLGVDKAKWLSQVQTLPINGYKIEFETTLRQGMSAERTIISMTQAPQHRHLSDVKEILGNSALPTKVTANALLVFTNLAEAEAKIHGCTVEEVHFHEVGAVDAIVDVVGVCLALDMLGVERIYCSPIGQGTGISKSAHGPMPLPPPATLELLRDVPVHFHDVKEELATPTGAALMKTLAIFIPPPGAPKISAVGYGAGSRMIPELPNLVRAILLEEEGSHESDQALLLETNIDDMNPEFYPFVVEKLLAAGAMDAYLLPVIMKKGRPGVILSALCAPELRDSILDVIYRQSSTLGVRIIPVDRLKLPRREIVVDTEYGPIKGKETEWKGEVRSAPEYEECRRIANQSNVPLPEVYKAYYAAERKLHRDS
ncbi:MAG: nickel pincer cofactor biosynthesis protein LarC [bacterium]|nr:nickel pincer cofactor biosynthesis protein LarC [bacterium]